MLKKNIKEYLKLYFITDHQHPDISMLDQVIEAVKGGVTMIQYRNKNFGPNHINEVYKIADFCKLNKIPFIINDDILLAKAVDADGVHLGQDDNSIISAKKVLGEDKIMGISISSYKEFKNTDLSPCDYIGLGPIFPTSTKKDAKPACHTDLIKTISKETDLPVTAIGGINKDNALSVINSGACGISVISAISRQENIQKAALEFALLLNSKEKKTAQKWTNEFDVIESIKNFDSFHKRLKVKAGDDSALLNPMEKPVISTDTQRQNVHFKLEWQTFYEIGYKAASVSLSDLAACYAKPESIFINLGLPNFLSQENIYEIYKGINDNIKRFDVSIGGGNISKSSVLSLDIFCIGHGCDIFPERSNALKNQLICSTGPLGLAKAGLEILSTNTSGFESLTHAFKYPEPKFKEAKILKAIGINCVTDISDGVYGDISHIAKQSHLTAEIQPQKFKTDKNLLAYCKKFKKDPNEYIISGGEDYELLFTCTENQFEEVQKQINTAFVLGKFKSFNQSFVESEYKGESFNHGKNG